MDRRIRRYEAMWTTDLRRYALVEPDPARPGVCLVMDLEAGGPLTMDDTEDVVAAVLAKMRAAGVRVISREDASPR